MDIKVGDKVVIAEDVEQALKKMRKFCTGSSIITAFRSGRQLTVSRVGKQGDRIVSIRVEEFKSAGAPNIPIEAIRVFGGQLDIVKQNSIKL